MPELVPEYPLKKQNSEPKVQDVKKEVQDEEVAVQKQKIKEEQEQTPVFTLPPHSQGKKIPGLSFHNTFASYPSHHHRKTEYISQSVESSFAQLEAVSLAQSKKYSTSTALFSPAIKQNTDQSSINDDLQFELELENNSPIKNRLVKAF